MRLYTQKIDTPDGPSKALVLEPDPESTFKMKFSRKHAKLLSKALLPDGKDIDFKGMLTHD